MLTADALVRLAVDLLPADACFAAAEISSMHLSTLTPKEQELCADWRDKRKYEFATGRSCARRVLTEAGSVDLDIDRDRYGAPLAPSSFNLSISHTAQYAAAAAIKSNPGYRTLGIDLEEASRIGPDIGNLAALPQEIARIQQHDSSLSAEAIIFSAKESTFKAAYPRVQRILDFDQILINAVSSSEFEALLLVDLPFDNCHIAGHFACVDGLIITTALFES